MKHKKKKETDKLASLDEMARVAKNVLWQNDKKKKK